MYGGKKWLGVRQQSCCMLLYTIEFKGNEYIMSFVLNSLLTPRKMATHYLDPEESVSNCAKIMSKHNIGSIVLKLANGEIVGIVSERDIVRMVVVTGLNPNDTKASDIALTEIKKFSSSDHIYDVMEYFTIARRRHVIVTDEKNNVYVVSIGDVVKELIDHLKFENYQLKDYIGR